MESFPEGVKGVANINTNTKSQKVSKVKNDAFTQKKMNNAMWGYTMIAPLMIGLFIFNILPILETVVYSFSRYKGFEPLKLTGIANYTKLFQDPNLLISLRNTLIFAIMTVPAGIIISVVIATLINNQKSGMKAFRTIYFLPQVTLPAAVAMAWMWLFNSDYGLLNQFLGIFGMPKTAWISSPSFALLSLSIVTVWGTVGYNMIILLAGLKNIPSVYYEASEIDGASPFVQFKRITLPLLSPTIFFLLVTSLINAMEVFDLIWIMIGRTSPVIDNVRSMVYTYYENAFVKYDKGYAAAFAMVLFVLIMAITAIQLRLQKKWVHYE